jgi:hypothetical protein
LDGQPLSGGNSARQAGQPADLPLNAPLRPLSLSSPFISARTDLQVPRAVMPPAGVLQVVPVVEGGRPALRGCRLQGHDGAPPPRLIHRCVCLVIAWGCATRGIVLPGRDRGAEELAAGRLDSPGCGVASPRRGGQTAALWSSAALVGLLAGLVDRRGRGGGRRTLWKAFAAEGVGLRVGRTRN